MELPSQLKNLIQTFTKLPGVGERTATRYSFEMLDWSESEINEMGAAVRAMAHVKRCEQCGALTEASICEICTDHRRGEQRSICAVEDIADWMAIERSHTFKGRYFILGGVLNPLIGIGPDDLGLNRLAERVRLDGVEEVILALNPSVEGDATCAYIKDLLPASVNVLRIGFGMPIGGSLEFLDSMTIGKALENRKRM
jgi:recombination protein RecR